MKKNFFFFIITIAILLGLLPCCRADVDLSNVDTRADVAMGFALPVGSMRITLGDFLGNVETPDSANQATTLYYDENGILTLHSAYDYKRTFDPVDLGQAAQADAQLKVYEPIMRMLAELGIPTLGNTIPSLPRSITVPLDYGTELVLDAINSNPSEARLDSAYITKANLAATLSRIDLPFQWDWVDTVLLVFEKEFRLNGSQEYLLYAKERDYSTINQFGEDLPIDLKSFTLDLVKDKNQPANADNVTNKTDVGIHIVINIPEGNEPLELVETASIYFAMEARLIEYDAVWGMFQPTEDLNVEDEFDLSEMLAGLDMLGSCNVPFAKPVIDVDLTTNIGGAMYLEGKIWAVDANGGKKYATFGDPTNTTVILPTDLVENKNYLPIDAPLDATHTIQGIRFDYTDENGHIDQLFADFPTAIGYKFAANFDSEECSQIRLRNNTQVQMHAGFNIPFTFHKGMAISYADTMQNFTLGRTIYDATQSGSGFLDSIRSGELKVLLRIRNEIPMQLQGVLRCLDANGRVITREDGTPFTISQNDTITFAAPSFQKADNQWQVATAGESDEWISIAESDLDLLAQAESLYIEILLNDQCESLQTLFEQNNDFAISLDKNAALTIQLGISAQADAVFNLDNLF
ncbi:MAG: hypothetical protein ACI4TV_03075 [Paludibacteraceae bacterium]